MVHSSARAQADVCDITTKFQYYYFGLAPDIATGSGRRLVVVMRFTGCALQQLAGMRWRLGSWSACGALGACKIE